jgi:2'-5' RNA ligase
MPYTIVLTPPAEQAIKYVQASQAFYSDYYPNYLLTKDGTSSPHITVVQFECESSDLAHQVWIKMREKMSKENIIPFNPPFTGVAFVEGAGLYANTTWVELSVKRGDKSSPIMKVHYAALEVLEQFGLKPLNACDNDYRPHLTLARITMPEQMKTWPKNICEVPGNFKLEFGLSDEKWQYAQTLESFP